MQPIGKQKKDKSQYSDDEEEEDVMPSASAMSSYKRGVRPMITNNLVKS